MNQHQLTLIAVENDWCAQCYTQRPIIHALAKKYSSKMQVHLINIEKNADIAHQYQLYSAPSLVLLVDGQVVERINRFMYADQLENLVRYYL